MVSKLNGYKDNWEAVVVCSWIIVIMIVLYVQIKEEVNEMDEVICNLKEIFLDDVVVKSNRVEDFNAIGGWWQIVN